MRAKQRWHYRRWNEERGSYGTRVRKPLLQLELCEKGIFRYFEHPVHSAPEKALEGKHVIQTRPKISVFRMRRDELPVRPGQIPRKRRKSGWFRRLKAQS